MKRAHFSEYDEEVTARCERVLLSLLGDIGPWSQRIYLAGGLAPRYLIGTLPEGARAHVGTTDIDVVIGLSLGDENPEVYRTLENNLKSAGFKDEASFRWIRVVDGVSVQLEFLCDTDQVEPGRIFKPKGESAGSGLGAFNVPGAQLAARDFIECDIEGERLDEGGRSKVTVRVANLLPYTVLKVLSFQDRHENKDAYDPVFCILNHEGGPRGRVPEPHRVLLSESESSLMHSISLLNDSLQAMTTAPARMRRSSPLREVWKKRLDFAEKQWPLFENSLTSFAKEARTDDRFEPTNHLVRSESLGRPKPLA